MLVVKHQLDNKLESLGKREIQLSKTSPTRLAGGQCLRGIFLIDDWWEKAQLTAASNPGQVVRDTIKNTKQNKTNKRTEKVEQAMGIIYSFI